MYRSSPAKSAMKPATSSRPCIESPASWRAAIHPSVRPSSVATSRSVSPRVMTPLKYASASSWVKRRSAARISTSSPRARSLASGSAGSARVASTRCTWAGRCSSEVGHADLDLGRVDGVVVVEHQHDVVRQRIELVEQGGQRRPRSRAPVTRGGTACARRHRAPRPAERRSGGSRTATGSLSPGSSESQAVDRSRSAGVAASHSATSVDFPKPAGAETRVSLDRVPRSQSLGQRGSSHQAAAPPGRVELGVEQRAGHAPTVPRDALDRGCTGL